MVTTKTFRGQLEEFYRANYDTLVRRMQNHYVSKHDAEDIVQETFTRLLRFETSFDGGDFEAWFYTILRNVLRASHNDRIMRGMSMDDSAEEPVDADTETKISSENVLAYINGLDNVNKKQIASLYLIEGMSYKEIDQVVPENMAAIRKTVQRVREEIKQHVL